ncbi:hypothetical protein [Aeromicrobium choanae]|uniref:Uncharacterized protein n=1 Tax=Aeromicrobium choanae TaxID=1736691 RepID=A0A1T4YX35_9ACTN|nr:hypothetical protein [Aeromicrobium choanae]SKB06350.1 hypothetical protein SAMN06295964_1276 [Aeromicrobium choanae]
MRRLRTTASRWAAAACLAIGLVYLTLLPAAPSRVYVVMEIVIAVVAGATALKMWMHNCFESHLGAGALVAATAGSSLLAMTVGLPGEGGGDLSGTRLVLLALSAAVVVLLVQDGRVRREQALRRRRPYAR